ncbi:2-hydroxyacid dehydrogenase [Shimia abyssi]|uniref:Glyoxylate/hydroxypyruvate reductase A n=1 Tax=Shimia abyssi TaxID=1662395 RepID=A0A2P8FKC9_9RHOB|nr:glyoxylate/hydroxypyruvate reductase A [Shimia abyssi]PSL22173.1 glyoxylate/hydroxypyruvate reductase A [Shimia abyssi]
MINALFAAHPDRWEKYAPALKDAFDTLGLKVDLRQDHAPDIVDYIVYAPNSTLRDFTPYTRCKAVLNLWAGVEGIVDNVTLTLPLARMVDPGMTRGMVEWVTGHTMRHHLGMDRNITQQNGTWEPHVPPLAADRGVTILGMGQLGMACARALSGLGFPVTGWSRTPKEAEGITCLHGSDGLKQALGTAEILILLLPNTPATENTLNATRLAMLPKGAFVINPGRGPLIDDDALLAALDRGDIAHATLDVFRVEPLPVDHPYWAHPRVTVTPHIASETRVKTASQVIAENIQRGEAGNAFLHVVDRKAGY